MQKYVFCEYNNKYLEYFSREKKRLESLLKDPQIEHVGSTSIPGLGGKGFIDIIIAVTKKEELNEATNKMIDAGYHFEPEASTENRIYFDIEFVDDNGNISMYHYHLTYRNSKDWVEMTKFRDYLRTNEEAREEYAAIKRHAAQIADNKRAKYVEIKNPVIEKLLKDALSLMR